MSATPIATSTAAPAHFADAMFDAGDAPQLRTILLTDICDSTGLVEVLGDKGAAQLFREHDRLVLGLQQQWRGRLIDRSDGLLLLFERPIDGLGFAIDYARGLAEIGKLRSIDIKIRAGLHVGEVLTWRNSEESVRVGAKPIEVEGLAKPTAARLMSMARPGQILLSAVAEPLAHRAARELGERGQHLIWKSLGRWRFKGVPEPQEIFEVGEPGLAPLRAPANSPKAWRAVPLWRRPAMLAAQLALVVAVGIGGWFVTRPAPAIAFGERDWVVVGDLRNLTGQTVLDESLEQAFRISLEQSRHVNVLSDLKTRDTLARMQLPADTVIDRDIASEIALRDGARAVILPTVAEVGGRLRVSAELVDPASQTTVYSIHADGAGVGAALEVVDEVVSNVRGQLGESLAAVNESSAPLPEVTTKSLDALRAYALAQASLGTRDYEDALRLYRRATDIDPGFALAYLGQMRVHYAMVDAPAALIPLRKAQSLRGRLPIREAMYMDAWVSEFDSPAQTSARWRELAELYPDYQPASSNAALWLLRDNRFADAAEYARNSLKTQNPGSAIDLDSLGRALLGQGKLEAAADMFSHAFDKGFTSASRRQLSTLVAARKYEQTAQAVSAIPVSNRHGYLEKSAASLDRARWTVARGQIGTARRLAEEKQGYDARSFLMPAATIEWLGGDSKAAAELAQQAAAKAMRALDDPANANAREDAELAAASALLLARMGDHSMTDAVVIRLQSLPKLKTSALLDLEAALRARQLLQENKASEAIEILRARLTGSERMQVRIALMDAYQAAGSLEQALLQSKWVQRRRGQAFAELSCGYCLQALNVADTNIALLREAELRQAQGRNDQLQKAVEDFDRYWPASELRGYFKERRSELKPVSS